LEDDRHVLQFGNAFSSLHIPNLGSAVVTGCDREFAATVKRHRINGAFMFPFADGRTVLNSPKSNETIGAASEKHLSVRTESDGLNSIWVFERTADRFSVHSIPNRGRTLLPGR
jgi:hypothetical protein